MELDGCAVFDTALGCCGIGWTPNGVGRVWLPCGSRQATLAAVGRDYPDVPVREPATGSVAARAVAEIQRLLAGERLDLLDVVVDFGHDRGQGSGSGPGSGSGSGKGQPDFFRRVYDVTRSIPVGSTLTYGEVAVRVGLAGSARAVGQALGRNPVPIVVPCHRVLAADGSMHGFSAPGGIETKRRMLRIEGALPEPAPTLF